MPGGEIGVSDIKSLAEKLVAPGLNLSEQEWNALEAILVSSVDGNIKYNPGKDTALSPEASMVSQIVTKARKKGKRTP